MNEYWVMKLVNDTTAVKQDVSIGRKTKTEIEITDPVFSADDRILVSGNYGLPGYSESDGAEMKFSFFNTDRIS